MIVPARWFFGPIFTALLILPPVFMFSAKNISRQMYIFCRYFLYISLIYYIYFFSCFHWGLFLRSP